MRQVDSLTDIEAFVETAHRLSFSRAAQALGSTQPVVSRRVARLEAQLGVRLLERTSRGLRLTDDGSAYLAGAGRLLQSYLEAEERVRDLRGQLGGHLRVALPGTFGRACVAPLIPGFLARHPRVEISLTLSNEFADLLREHIDLAIRIGSLPDSSLVARRLGGNQRILVAAPQYLAARGTPERPADLHQHNCLLFTALPDASVWRLRDEHGNEQRVGVRGTLCADDLDALRHGALGGLGVTVLPRFYSEADLIAARLVRVLPAWRLPDTAVFAVFPSSEYVPLRVRAFVDHLIAALSAAPGSGG